MDTPSKTRPLNAKRRAFVDHYLNVLNQTQAAILAGYPTATAQEAGSQLMDDPRVKLLIDEGMAKMHASVQDQKRRIIEELALLSFSDVTNYTPTDDGKIALTSDAPNGATRAISRVKHKITRTTQPDGTLHVTHEIDFGLHPKAAAAQLLMKHHGMIVDRIGDPDGKPLAPTVIIKETAE